MSYRLEPDVNEYAVLFDSGSWIVGMVYLTSLAHAANALQGVVIAWSSDKSLFSFRSTRLGVVSLEMVPAVLLGMYHASGAAWFSGGALTTRVQLALLPYLPMSELASTVLMACLWRENARVVRAGKGFLPRDPLDTASGPRLRAVALLLVAGDIILMSAATSANASGALVMVGIAVILVGQMACGGYFLVSCCKVRLPIAVGLELSPRPGRASRPLLLANAAKGQGFAPPRRYANSPSLPFSPLTPSAFAPPPRASPSGGALQNRDT